jgi:hypothetical protein
MLLERVPKTCPHCRSELLRLDPNVSLSRVRVFGGFYSYRVPWRCPSCGVGLGPVLTPGGYLLVLIFGVALALGILMLHRFPALEDSIISVLCLFLLIGTFAWGCANWGIAYKAYGDD